jgi:carbonic anhydrase
VLGHTKCGAVKGACDHVEMGNLTALLLKIQPAVLEEKTETGDRSSANNDFVEKVSKINVKRTVHAIMERSPILKEMIESGRLGIVGGSHDITSGEVTFYPETLLLNTKWVNE